MRVVRLGLVLSILFFNMPLRAQQPQTPSASPEDPTATAVSPAANDPQAVSVVTQALAVAGGLSAITVIDDYTATGTVTYHHGSDEVSGPVTIRESGLSQLRIDAQLPTGIRSQAISGGELTVNEHGVTSTSWDPPPFYAGRIVVPGAFLAAASMSPQFSLTYRGTVEINGRSAHDIEVLRVVPGSERIRYREGLTVHLFVDASTWQVVMMQDVDPRNQIRQIQYSDYGAVNGALIPFAISEQIANRQTWAIQLSQVSFNTGLQDSDFQL